MSIAKGGLVNNSMGYIGYALGANDSSVLVTSSGSVWHNRDALYLGGHKSGTNWVNGGSGNSLSVRDGGWVLVGDVDTHILPDVGAEGGLVVGDTSGHAELIAANESLIDIGYACIGLASNEFGSITIAGGSQMDVGSFLLVGDEGSGNSLFVADGGRIENATVLIGNLAQSSNNTVSVSGWGSICTNLGDLYVGCNGSGNSLHIEDGGQIQTRTSYLKSIIIGSTMTATSNSVVVEDLGSKLDTAAVFTGLEGSSNSLGIYDGGIVNSFVGIIGDTATATGNTVAISGLGSMWVNENQIYIGESGSGNTLTIDDGGVVSDASAYIGHSYGSSNNYVSVRGPGSRLVNSYNVYVGSSGSSNRLIIADGGRVESSHGYIGYGAAASNNSVVVSGVGSVWSNASTLHVGYVGASNSLMISDGGRVENSTGYIGLIGFIRTDGNNAVSVTGEGSLWHNREALYLGGYKSGTNWIDAGTGNSLTVEKGGWVQVGDVDINNLPDVGTSGGIMVGDASGTAEMIVANGSRVNSDIGFVGFVGFGTNASGLVTVTGDGSVWSNSTGLLVGQGAGSRVSVLDGGQVDSEIGWVGLTDHAMDNTVVVSGAGSKWNISSGIEIGFVGSGGSMLVANGGQVANDGYGSIGNASSANSNFVTVTDADSVWDNAGNLYVGYNGSGNTLRIEDGGKVYAQNSAIGYGETANGNRVVVSGEDSVWGHGWTVPRLGEPATPVFEWPTITNLPPIDWPGLTNNPVLPWPPFIVITMSTNSSASFGGSLTLSGNNTYFVGDVSSGGTLAITNAGSFWGGGVLTLDGNLELGSHLTNNLWSATNVGSFLSGAGMSLSSGNQLVITDGGFIGGSGGFVLIGTNLLDMGSSLGGSGFWLNPTNLVVQGGTFTGELAVASTNSRISITNNMPPPVFALRIEANFGDLSIGRGGSDNTLEISNGALVANYNGIIGETSNAWNNAVSVVGTNSEWRNMRDLYIGGRMSQLSYMMEDGWFTPWIDGGRGNSLYVGDGGLVTVGRDMHNRNYSTVSVDPGGHISIASNYYQDATSVLRFGVETNAAGAPLNALVSVGGTAEFETGATLEYHSNVGVLDFNTFYTNLIVAADRLIVGGVTNANALDLETINLDGALVDVLLWEDDQDIYGLVGRRHLADSAGFAAGSQMALLSKGIDDLSLLGNPEAVRQINLLNGMSSAQQNAQLTQRYAQGSPTYMHRQAMLDGRKQVMAQSRTFQSGRHAEEAAPEGAAGPHGAEQGLRGWMRGYGSWADRDGSGSSSGFDQSIYGTVVGIDQSYGNVLLGAAGGYAHSDLTQDNHDSTDADTGFGILYGSVGTADWFGDLNLSYGRSRVDIQSGTALGGKGSFDADNYAVHVGGGKEIPLTSAGLLFTPEAALLVGYYGQESYNDGLMDVDAYDRWSYQSRLGAAFALPRQCGGVVLKPEVRAYWLHEFNAEADRIGYSLTGGTGRYTFGVQAPDEDVLEAGTGLGIAFSDRLEIVLDVDGQYSDRYESITVSGRAVYEF